MLAKTYYSITEDLLAQARENIPKVDFRLTLNEPTGNFFYDSWVIKNEYKDTVWDLILQTLPFQLGEARIIILEPNSCYTSHGDIDDRWHLNITGERSFVVDLTSNKMYPQVADTYWYTMTAGPVHSAVNFNNKPRVQLVVRHLLNRNELESPISVKILPNSDRTDLRFQFDQIISPWLNQANKRGIISNFVAFETSVSFDVHGKYVDELLSITPDYFKVETT